MPIYEYQCEDCQQMVEAWQSLADEPLSTCHSCSGSLKKMISRSSFHLKGGGWYADGYSGGNAKACAGQEKSCGDSCPVKSSTEAVASTESKPSCGQGACCDA